MQIMQFRERRQVPGEIALHFPGLRSLDKPHVYVCSEVIVCLVCGAAQFSVPEAELLLLAKGDSDVLQPNANECRGRPEPNALTCRGRLWLASGQPRSRRNVAELAIPRHLRKSPVAAPACPGSKRLRNPRVVIRITAVIEP